MTTVLTRTAIMYFIFIFSIRIMGKRQIGELQLSELVTTLMLSEIAISSIQDISMPLSYSILPTAFLLSSEVIISFLATKSSGIKKLFFGTPNIIIKEGKIDQKELSKLRMSINELLSELRLKDISEIDDVDYAIIEHNGKISVFPKMGKRPLCKEDIDLKSDKENSLPFAVITDGDVSKTGLGYANKNEKWLKNYLNKKKIDKSDIYLMTVNREGKINIIYKEEK